MKYRPNYVQTDVLANASFIPLRVKDSSLLRYADSSLEKVVVMVGWERGVVPRVSISKLHTVSSC